MTTALTHFEIAKERFLEMMATHPNGDARGTAVVAIEQADEFMNAYSALRIEPDSPQIKMRGCRACYGSGGKVGHPCKTCGGSGKVVVE